MLLSNLNYCCKIVKSVRWWTLVFLPAPLMLCCYSCVCQKTGNINPAHGCNNWDFVQQEQTKNTGRVNYSKILAFSYTLTKSTLLDNSQTKTSSGCLWIRLDARAKRSYINSSKACVIQSSWMALLAQHHTTSRVLWDLANSSVLNSQICMMWALHNKEQSPDRKSLFLWNWFLDNCQVVIPGHAMWPNVLKWQLDLQMTIPNKRFLKYGHYSIVYVHVY